MSDLLTHILKWAGHVEHFVIFNLIFFSFSLEKQASDAENAKRTNFSVVSFCSACVSLPECEAVLFWWVDCALT